MTKIKILEIAQQKRDEKRKLLQLKDAANHSQARELFWAIFGCVPMV